MKKIAIEEHYCPKSYNDYLLSRSEAPRLEIIRDKDGGVKAYREWSQVGYTTLPLKKQDVKCQLGGQRLKDVDEVGIDMQVVSWPAGGLEKMAKTEAGKLAKKMNDDISRAIKKHPSRYVHDNFYITTSGMMWQPLLQFVCAALGAEKVLFATDYIHEDLLESVQAVQNAPIDDDSKEKIFHLNAERLLNL